MERASRHCRLRSERIVFAWDESVDRFCRSTKLRSKSHAWTNAAHSQVLTKLTLSGNRCWCYVYAVLWFMNVWDVCAGIAVIETLLSNAASLYSSTEWAREYLESGLSVLFWISILYSWQRCPGRSLLGGHDTAGIGSRARWKSRTSGKSISDALIGINKVLAGSADLTMRLQCQWHVSLGLKHGDRCIIARGEFERYFRVLT